MQTKDDTSDKWSPTPMGQPLAPAGAHPVQSEGAELIDAVGASEITL
jgi:hypothetical protein